MLVAAVIQLKALQSGRIHGSTGRAVHGFWYQQWQDHNPAVANALHQIRTTLPYTLSPLMDLPRPKRGTTVIRTGTTAWLRITILDSALVQPFLENWLRQLAAHIQIMHINWAVTAISFTPDQHPWAATTSYRQILDRNLGTPRQPQSWTLQFQTPTAFHAGNDNYLPFPLPNALVGSWLRRWQAFSPFPLQIDLHQRLRDDLLVSAYDLKTIPLRTGRNTAIGCVGNLTLLTRKFDAEERALVSILCDYAFYAGSGHHTTQGMGMTRKKG